jgi:recombination protein RecT
MASRRTAPRPAATATAPAAASAAPAATTTAIEKPVPRHQVVRRTIERAVPYIKQLIPEKLGLDAERFARVVINCIESDDSGKLLQCTDGSIIRAVLHAAEVGLEPGGAYGHCYILPYLNKKTNCLEAEFMIGVWGYVELARRNPRIKDVWADVIFEKDQYDVESGSGGRRIIHKPRWDLSFTERGQVLGAYACALFDDGTVASEMMNWEELQQARSTSKAPDSPAWANWPTEMYKRSALKRAQKYWSKGNDRSLQRAIELEERPDIVSLPVQAAIATLAPTPAAAKPKPSGPLDALVNAHKPAAPAPAPAAPAGKPANDRAPESLTWPRVHAALAEADEDWQGEDRLTLIMTWTPEQMALAHNWAAAVNDQSVPEDQIPERPAFTVLERMPGEEG